jgi:heparinase II/III-like protein
MPGLNWYRNRLRAMSPAEVGYRLRQMAQARVDRLRLAMGRLPGAAYSSPSGAESLELPFFFDPARAEEMRATWSRDFPEGLARLRAEADELLAGRAMIFDREMTWTDAPNWHANLLQGGEWPRRFWAEVPIRDGGVKYAWELARHQHLMTLARAAFLTGEAPYGDTACRWLLSWIDENPPYVGIHWTSPLELGLRLIAWSWIYRLLRPRNEPLKERGAGWTHELEREFYRFIQIQVGFIRRYHSAHSSANNHLIGEAAGVMMAGLAFPWLAEAGGWRDWGLSILARELPRQCHEDGVSAEQTFHYQAFVMDLVLQPVLLARHQARETPVELLDRLEAMAGFLYAAMDASGALPSVGDADDGAAILLGQDLHHPYRSLLATCGVLFKRPEFCRAAGRFDEKSAWLLGATGRERFERLVASLQGSGVRGQGSGGTSPALRAPTFQDDLTPDPRPLTPVSQSFPAGGYTVMRGGSGSSEQLLMLDHGPLGYLSIAAHGHADCLSLTMHVGGQPVLVDPGTYTYHEQPVWREYFRGTTAHNTVTVDGQHQSVMTGPTMWGRRAHARQTGWTTQPAFDFVEAEHDGYQRLPGRPLHSRAVFHRRGAATFVVDRLLGDHSHQAELTWHLPPKTAVRAAGDNAWAADGDGFRLWLALLSDAAAETVIVEGDVERIPYSVSGSGEGDVVRIPYSVSDKGGPAFDFAGYEIRNTLYAGPQGWVSPRFGVRVPAPVLCSRRSGPLPMVWLTVLLPTAAGDPLPAVHGRLDARGAMLTLAHPGGREIYAQAFIDPSHGPASPPTLDLGEGRFQGRAAHLLLDEAGRLMEFCGVGGLELEWQSRVVWRATNGPEDAHVVLLSPETADSGLSPVSLGRCPPRRGAGG